MVLCADDLRCGVYTRFTVKFAYLAGTYGPLSLGTVYLYGKIKHVLSHWNNEEKKGTIISDIHQGLSDILYDWLPTTITLGIDLFLHKYIQYGYDKLDSCLSGCIAMPPVTSPEV